MLKDQYLVLDFLGKVYQTKSMFMIVIECQDFCSRYPSLVLESPGKVSHATNSDVKSRIGHCSVIGIAFVQSWFWFWFVYWNCLSMSC